MPCNVLCVIASLHPSRRNRYPLLALAGVLGALLALVAQPFGLQVGVLWYEGVRGALTQFVPTMAIAGIAMGVLIVPGFGVRRFMRLRDEDLGGDLAVSVVLSVLAIGGLGALLVGFRIMSRDRLALLILIPFLLGIVPALEWLKRCFMEKPKLIAGFGVLAIPWMWLAAQPGLPPAEVFQWWYWDLGRYLTEAGGIPSWVAEYGTDVRWLPDYLIFNLLSETYAGFGSVVADDSLMQYWKVSVLLIALPMTYMVFRLWVGRLASFVGLVVLVGSTFWTAKFNAYKPEAVGIVIGLACVWLLVHGLRERRVEFVLLAGIGLGVNMAIHGVAAVVVGFLLLAAALAELVWSHRGRWRDFIVLASAAVLAGALILSVGIGLQGRAIVAGDAFNPKISSGGDPTWRFLRLSVGVLDVEPVPTLREQIDENLRRVERPWGKSLPVDVTSAWLAIPIVAGLIMLGVKGGERERAGFLALLIFAGLLMASAVLFAVSFVTFVPRHTGISRMSQYMPMAIALAMALSVEGYRRALNGIRVQREFGMGDIVGAGVLTFALAMGVAVPLASYQSKPVLTEAGRDGTDALRIFSTPGDRVLSNATTRGTVESLTRIDSLLEGRQPLIEDAEFLDHTNETLESAIRFFRSPAEDSVLTDFGVRWLLISDKPALLGAEESFGGSVEQFRGLPQFREVWSAEGVALFETDVISQEPRFGPAETYRRSLAYGALILAVGLIGATAAGYRFGWNRQERDGARQSAAARELD